jgi:hypothetical protein
MRKSIKYGSIILIVFLIFMVTDCSPELNSKLHYDRYNPCGVEYPNLVECNTWKTKYTKEYLKYLDRLEKLKRDTVNQ